MKQGASLLSLTLILALCSCVGIDADSSIASDGSVQVSLAYTVSAAADELGRMGANAAYLPLPVGRDDLALAASRAGGELRSWRREEGRGSFTVNASLRFPSPEAFAAFLDPAGERASFSSDSGLKTLSLRLSDGLEPADADLSGFMRAAFGDYLVALRFTTPAAPVAASGLSVSGRTASFSMRAADLFSSPLPQSLSLSWR